MAAQSRSGRTGKVSVGKASSREGGCEAEASPSGHCRIRQIRATCPDRRTPHSVVTIDSEGHISLANKGAPLWERSDPERS